MPTLLGFGVQEPAPPAGDRVEHLPPDVEGLYAECLRSLGANNHTCAVLAGRKLLMNVAVTKGAKPGLKYEQYVDYFVDEGLITADMRDWVDEIRKLGNEANHGLLTPTREDAEGLATLVAMLLKIVYEYPERGRRSSQARAARKDG